MKLIFICGSLEPGRDGVGDYTRRLAGELKKKRQQVGILALNDPFLNGAQETCSNGEKLEVLMLRLGIGLTTKKRFMTAKTWIDHFDPEWISLQYVPFSFHRKGLPWGLDTRLTNLGKGRKWHIMFHELWAGMNKRATYKQRILSFMQKFLIKRMIFLLDPKIINTHVSLYRAQLQKLGKEATILSLFGNIKVESGRVERSDNIIRIAIFGWIHTQAKFNDFIQWLQANKRLHYQFHFLGGNGDEKENWIKILRENCIEYNVHGWLPEEKISSTLLNCQWSITSTPYYLVEKSGTVAAMLEHGLNIFCIGRDWVPRGIAINKLEKHKKVINWGSQINPELLVTKKGQHLDNQLSNIAHSFLQQINKH